MLDVAWEIEQGRRQRFINTI